MMSVEELIIEKEYHDLTESEKEFVKELACSEQEYAEVKSFLLLLNASKVDTAPQVSPEIKSSLDHIFQSKHPGITANWNALNHSKTPVIPLYRKKWFRVAALLVVSGGILTFWLYPPVKVIDLTYPNQRDMAQNQTEQAEVNNQKSKVIYKSDKPSDETSNASIFKNEADGMRTEVRAGSSSLTEEEALSLTIPAANPNATINPGLDADLNPLLSRGDLSAKQHAEVPIENLLSLIEPSF